MNEDEFARVYAIPKCPESHKYIAEGVSSKQKHLCEWMEWK